MLNARAALVLYGVVTAYLLFSYVRYSEQYFQHYFNPFGNSWNEKSVVQTCIKVQSLRDYCSTILQCRKTLPIDISSDVSVLHEAVLNPNKSYTSTKSKIEYLKSDAFLKFKKFHKSTGSPLSIHLLDDDTCVIRVPVLDTLESPNNEKKYSYVFPLPIIHPTHRINSPFSIVANKTFTIGKAAPFKSAFLIANNAIAHSKDGNVLAQTCQRAITVIGCSVMNVSSILESIFPSAKNISLCTKNSVGSNVTVISVNKLLVIAHTWYNAFYHLTIEAMSRLMLLHELILFDPEIYILLQYPIYSKSATQLLNLFGISNHRIIYYDSKMEQSTLFRANTMFIPRGIPCGGAPPALLEQIHSKGLNPSQIGVTHPRPYLSLPLPTTSLQDKPTLFSKPNYNYVKNGPIVLISRNNARGRTIKNEIEIINFLSTEYSAIPLTVFYGNLSLLDTIALFHSARVLVAPHGAGQLHVLWMRPGSVMIEISSQDNYNGCYQSIATYRQVQTAIYFDSNATARSTFIVNITVFKALFHEVIKSRI